MPSYQYTNGFNVTSVLNALRSRIGWRQPVIEGSPQLDRFNLSSVSGRFYQSFHSLVTIKNIVNNIEDANISVPDLNALLKDLQDDAILRILNQVFRQQELFEQKLLYTRSGFIDMPVSNSNQFIGYAINVANEQSVTSQITMCTLYFDTDVTFNLYLFKDGEKLPIATKEVSCVAFQRTEIDFSDLYLNYSTGRRYYFGYFQSDLGNAKAIREQVDYWASTRYFEAYCMAAPAENIDFNRNYKQYGSLPQGLNLEIISFKDHTQKIIRNAAFFDEVIGLSVAALVIEMYVMNTRSNKDDRKVNENSVKAYNDLNQSFATEQVPFMPGIKSRIAGEIKKLIQTFYPAPQSVSVCIENHGVNDYWVNENLRILNNPPPYLK